MLHYMRSIPDPTATYRGMSWLTPIVREIQGDQAATQHKLKFFENGATPNLVVTLDPAITPETFERWVEKFEGTHEGLLNAYRTMYLGGGASADVVGANCWLDPAHMLPVLEQMRKAVRCHLAAQPAALHLAMTHLPRHQHGASPLRRGSAASRGAVGSGG